MTDDKLVTNHARSNCVQPDGTLRWDPTWYDDPLKSDSVQLFVDVRPSWKQEFMNAYTPGTLELILVPDNDGGRATYKWGTRHLGNVYGLASRRTARGYTIELDLHFHTGEVEDPGWVANRPVRIGVLVNDSDDPQGAERQTTMGVWRTAADAGESCLSLTTFWMEK